MRPIRVLPLPRLSATIAAALLASLTVSSTSARAQTTTQSFTACSQGVLANCAGFQLTSRIGAGAGGLNLFEIAVQNLGSQASPSATSLYFLSLTTGLTSGAEVFNSVTPESVGGAAVLDPSPWGVVETGDAIFLSALLGNDGIGGCALAAPVDGFGQMAQTCGDSQFITFSFSTAFAYDAANVRLSDLEIVGLSSGTPSDSCNEATGCVIAPFTSVPEPSTLALAFTGLSGIAGMARRRRRSPAA